MLAAWPRVVRARIVGARRDHGDDFRRSRYVVEPKDRLILTLGNIGDLPLQMVRVLSPAVVACVHPSPEVHEVTIARWWVSDRLGPIPRGGIAICVGPVAESPANFVGGVFVQHQAAPLCPCQRHNAARRATGECVCTVNGVIAPCGGVRATATEAA